MPRNFPWRFLVYALVILYLWLDLYVFEGPVSRKIQATRVTNLPSDVAATVNAHPITERELDSAIDIYCLTHGIDSAALSEKRKKAIRATVLNQRIGDLVIWMYSRVVPIEIDEAEVASAIDSFKQQFESEEEFEKRLRAQGMDRGDFEEWIRSQTHQRLWLETKIAPGIKVDEKVAEVWRAAHPASSQIPEVLRARHIFLATLDKDPAEVGSSIRAIHAQLTSGEKTFEALAREFSEDQRTKKAGGDLKHFTRARMPADFYDAVHPLELNKPSAPFQTELGWHIAELTERIPGRKAVFEEVKDEIVALLESEKRETAVRLLIDDYKSRANIKIYRKP